MSAIGDILDRLSGVTALKERLEETNRNVDRALGWLLDHEKRIIRLEAHTEVKREVKRSADPSAPRLTRK